MFLAILIEIAHLVDFNSDRIRSIRSKLSFVHNMHFKIQCQDLNFVVHDKMIVITNQDIEDSGSKIIITTKKSKDLVTEILS